MNATHGVPPALTACFGIQRAAEGQLETAAVMPLIEVDGTPLSISHLRDSVQSLYAND
jgi:hypothetical protein